MSSHMAFGVASGLGQISTYGMMMTLVAILLCISKARKTRSCAAQEDLGTLALSLRTLMDSSAMIMRRGIGLGIRALL